MSAPIDLARTWSIDDLESLPDDTHRYEIVDGNLLVSPAPEQAHQWRAALLAEQLRAQTPPGWLVMTELSIALDPDFRIPDAIVHRWPLTDATRFRRYPLSPSDVGLVLEVVSPRSRKTDRLLKPVEYAEAGIGVFWRLECEPALVLHPFRLVDGVYVAADPLTTTGVAPAPWGQVEVDLSALP